MNSTIYLEYNNVRIRPLEQRDIESLRVWRNDTETSKYLTAHNNITREMQEKWYRDYLSDESLFIWAISSITEVENLVGSAALYNFRNKTCEQGKIMIAPKYSRRGFGKTALIMIAHIGFSIMNVVEIDARVNANNIASLQLFKSIGYIVHGDQKFNNNDDNESYLIITKEAFYRHNQLVFDFNLISEKKHNYESE